jgi:hypothetical protein
LSLRIAFDLDGVFADMDAALIRHAESLFGRAPTPQPQAEVSDVASPEGDPPATGLGSASDGPSGPPPSRGQLPPLPRLNLTARQERRLWEQIESIENFWQTLEEIEPGVIRRLSAIAADHRWEVIFLTKRPDTAGSTAQVQSQRWLESKGFLLPSVFVLQGSRGRLAAALALDVVVDDRPENCLDVVDDSKARAILVWRDADNAAPAAASRLGIGVVKTVDECLNILVQIDSPAPDKPSILARALQLLGLKQSAQP